MTELTKPLASYTHSRRVGDLLFIAGQGSRDPKTNCCAGITKNQTGEITHYDITAQTKGVFENIDRVLMSAGLTRKNIVDVTVFLTDMKDFEEMNAVWNIYFKDVPAPTRTTVAVRALPGDNFVEMKAIASFSL